MATKRTPRQSVYDKIAHQTVIGLLTLCLVIQLVPTKAIAYAREQMYDALMQEEYVSDDLVYSDYGPIVVPEGYIFAMGDNRPVSVDSRALGCFPADNVLGRVVIRFIPFRIFHRIRQ